MDAYVRQGRGELRQTSAVSVQHHLQTDRAIMMQTTQSRFVLVAATTLPLYESKQMTLCCRKIFIGSEGITKTNCDKSDRDV